MTIDEFKTKVEKHRVSLGEKDGKVCTFSKAGPIGIDLIDALVAVIESQQKQIDDLRTR